MKVKKMVEKLIDASFDNWRTKKYDDYQFKTNGILKWLFIIFTLISQYFQCAHKN